MAGIFGTGIAISALGLMNVQAVASSDHGYLPILLCTADGRYVEVRTPVENDDGGGEDDQCVTACHAMNNRSRSGNISGDGVA